MKVLTYTLYKEHCDLYTEIHGSIAVNSCQIELTHKDIILLSKAFIITYRTGKRIGVENHKFIINFNLSAGTYSIDDFNAKIKEAVLQQGQGWEPSQIKDLKLVIPEDYTFMTDNTIFIAFGIPDNYLKKTMVIRSKLPPGLYKTSLNTSPPPKLFSLHCKQINKVKNKLDGQSSSSLAHIHLSNYNATFSPIHLVFLELDTHQPHLDFKILDENNNEVILRTFYLQLLYDNETKIYPNLNPTASQEPQTYRLKKLTEIEAFFLDEIEVCKRTAKKMKQFNTITGIVDTGLITSTVITRGVSIAAFASGVGLPVGIALSGTSLLLTLVTVITQKSFKTLTIKEENHNSVKPLAQSKLDSIANIISQAMQDEVISFTEFHKVLQEVEKYCKL